MPRSQTVNAVFSASGPTAFPSKSTTPPTAVAITGRALSIASINVSGVPSLREVKRDNVERRIEEFRILPRAGKNYVRSQTQGPRLIFKRAAQVPSSDHDEAHAMWARPRVCPDKLFEERHRAQKSS